MNNQPSGTLHPLSISNGDQHGPAKVNVVIGFDCDRPRDDFFYTSEGQELAKRKLHSLQRLKKVLNHLNLPRTYFICGLHLENMCGVFGSAALRDAFDLTNSLVEIGDHTYSHSVLKKIPTRPDRIPISVDQVREEYKRNTAVFKEHLGLEILHRGFRAPLGHFNGLTGEKSLLDALLQEGVRYISSDLHGINENLEPSLYTLNGVPRQPYRYPNGLLEIPSMGWQDTVFTGTAKPPIMDYPHSYNEIIEYYKNLFTEAHCIAQRTGKDYFLGLVIHPFDNIRYDQDGLLFYDLHQIINILGGTFCKYEDVLNQLD